MSGLWPIEAEAGMAFFYPLKKIVIIIFIASTFLGCSGKSESLTSRSQSLKNYAKEPKPGAPVKLISDSIVSINPGQATRVVIELEAHEREGQLDIDFVPSDGLTILDTDSRQTISLSDSLPIKFPVTLLAHTDGRYYLNMHIRIENGESSSNRALALIVQLGAESDTIKFKKADGVNVISLPAQEKILTK
jgi:hypothetical protein